MTAQTQTTVTAAQQIDRVHWESMGIITPRYEAFDAASIPQFRFTAVDGVMSGREPYTRIAFYEAVDDSDVCGYALVRTER